MQFANSIIAVESDNPTPNPHKIAVPSNSSFAKFVVIVSGIVAELVLPNFFKEVGNRVLLRSNFFSIVEFISLFA